MHKTLAMRRKIDVWQESPACRAATVSSKKTNENLAKTYPKHERQKTQNRCAPRSKKWKTQWKIEPETALPRICVRILRKSAAEATRRHPKSGPKRPKSVRGAPCSMPGASRARPGNVPSAYREHSEMHLSAPRVARSVSEMIWSRFGRQNGAPDVDFRGCRGCVFRLF